MSDELDEHFDVCPIGESNERNMSHVFSLDLLGDFLIR